MGIVFLAELSQLAEYTPELANASNVDRRDNIYQIYIGTKPTNTYWTDWGGTYDTVETNDLELFFSGFLTKTFSYATLIATNESFFISGDIVYINIPKKPWQYRSEETALRLAGK